MLGYLSEKDFRDEETGNDEEDVYADVAAADHLRKGVIQHDRNYGKRPQTIYVRAVVVGCVRGEGGFHHAPRSVSVALEV